MCRQELGEVYFAKAHALRKRGADLGRFLDAEAQEAVAD